MNNLSDAREVICHKMAKKKKEVVPCQILFYRNQEQGKRQKGAPSEKNKSSFFSKTRRSNFLLKHSQYKNDATQFTIEKLLRFEIAVFFPSPCR